MRGITMVQYFFALKKIKNDEKAKKFCGKKEKNDI